MSSLKDRVAAAFARREKSPDPRERVSRAALARAAGVKQPSVTDWFKGRTVSLKGDTLLRAAKYLRVRPEWLESGAGPMTLSAAEAESDRLTDHRPAWPFPEIDENLIASAAPTDRDLLAGALLVSAARLGIEIRKRRSA